MNACVTGATHQHQILQDVLSAMLDLDDVMHGQRVVLCLAGPTRRPSRLRVAAAASVLVGMFSADDDVGVVLKQPDAGLAFLKTTVEHLQRIAKWRERL